MSAGMVTIAIAALHTVVGLVMAWAPLRDIVMSGVIGQVDSHWDRAAAFWFLFFGFLLAAYGDMLRRFERAAHAVPAQAGYQLAALCLGGALVMPASGFWTGLIPAAMIIARSRRQRTPHGRRHKVNSNLVHKWKGLA